jgi:large conductance mechanosensitive channel
MADIDLKQKGSELADKGKGFFGEFRKFIMRGNVIDLAVGVIIGAAFQAIVNSLVNDIVMPVISLLTGGIDFSNWFISLDGSHYKTLAAAQKAGAATLNYGKFLTAVINFILMALVIFVMVKLINDVNDRLKKPEEEPAKTTKVCPYCQSEIPIKATRCPHCTSEIPVDPDFKS